MPQQPRFVLGSGSEVETQTFEDYPEHAPSDLIVVEARFDVMGMVITPTCHVSEGEKDEEIVAVVPVQALNLVIPLGLYVEARIELRKALARFWARGDASADIEKKMRPQIEQRPLEDLE